MGFFESDEDHGRRLRIEAAELTIANLIGTKPEKGFLESDEEYERRLGIVAAELTIEKLTGTKLEKGWLESDEEYELRLKNELAEQTVANARAEGLERRLLGDDHEDQEFELNPDLPFVLLLENVQDVGILNFIKASHRQYKLKRLRSLPQNWESISALFDTFDISAVLLRLPPDIFGLLSDADYAECRERLFSRIALHSHLIFVYEDILTGEDRGKWETEARPYPPRDDIAEVLSWLDSKGIRLTPYRKNAEITVLAERFLAECASNLVLRLYVPNERLWANEIGRFLQLFRDYLARVAGLDVRLDERRTGQGTVYEFHSVTAQSQSVLHGELSDFRQLLNLCSSDTGAAETLLRSKSIAPAAASEIVTRYAKEAKRLQIDSKHDLERKLLSIHQRLESELVDMNLTSDECGTIVKMVEDALPSFDLRQPLPLVSLGGTVGQQHANLTINLRPQIVNTANAIVAQEIFGDQHLGPEAREIALLIKQYGGDRAMDLESALHEVSDGTTPPQDRLSAGQKLKGFLMEAGRRSVDIGTGVLQAYIQKQCGL